MNDSIVIVNTLSKHIEINHKIQTCCSLHIKYISLCYISRACSYTIHSSEAKKKKRAG